MDIRPKVIRVLSQPEYRNMKYFVGEETVMVTKYDISENWYCSKDGFGLALSDSKSLCVHINAIKSL